VGKLGDDEMRAIKARYDGRVFVPEEEVDLAPGAQAVLTVDEAKQDRTKWRPPEGAEKRRIKKQLQDHFDRHFPELNLKAEGWLVDLVGVLPPMTDEEIKEMYYMHFLETDE